MLIAFDPTTDLELTIDIAASPATIWRYFADPVAFAEWLGVSAVLHADQAFTITYPDERQAIGRVLESEPERRMVWSWGYVQHGQPQALPPESTQVQFTFEPIASGTRVTLRHVGLPSAEARFHHRSGWNAWLAQLAQLGLRSALAQRIPQLIAAWSQSWNSTDPALRGAILAECCAPDCSFRDPTAQCADRDAIDAWIAGVQTYMPGVTLEASGAALQTLDQVLWRWEGRLQGQIIARGYNVARIGPAGTFIELTGFWNPATA